VSLRATAVASSILGAAGSSSNNTADLIIGLVVFAIVGLIGLAPIVISWRKGHIGLALLGLVFLPFAIYGALITARPDSPWAKARYSPEQMEKARERFPEPSPLGPQSTRPLPQGGRTSTGTTVPAGRGVTRPEAASEPFPDVGGKPAPGFESGPPAQASKGPQAPKAPATAASSPDSGFDPAPVDTGASVFGSDRQSQAPAGGWDCLICGQHYGTKTEAEMHVSTEHRGAPLGSSVGEAT